MAYLFKNGIKYYYIIFILLITWLIIIISQKDNNIDLTLLWSIIVSLILIIFSHILLNYNSKIILLEIMAISLLLHFLFIPQVGLLGYDSQFDFNLVKLIDKFGWSFQLPSTLAAWPLIHILIIVFSKISELSLLDSSRYLPSIISTLLILPLFSLMKRLVNNNYMAIIAVILFSIISYNNFFHSLPIRETLGFPIMFVAILCYILGTERSDNRLIALAYILGLALIMAHHFTVFMFIIFLITLNTSQLSVRFNLFNIHSYKYSVRYLLVISISTLLYWALFSQDTIDYGIKSLHSFVEWGSIKSNTLEETLIAYPPLINLQTHIYSISRILTCLVAFYIILNHIIYKYRTLNIYDLTFLIYSSFAFGIWILLSFGIIKMIIFPERFELFAWAFLLLFLSPIIYKALKASGSPSLKLILIFFLISFIAMNFSQIQPYIYSAAVNPPYENGLTRVNYLPQEYAAADWFRGGGKIFGDFGVDALLNQRITGSITIEPDILRGNLSRIKYFDWIIIRKEMFQIVTVPNKQRTQYEPLILPVESYKKINLKEGINKVYANDEVEIYS